LNNLRLSGKKFAYRNADPNELLNQVNFAYDLLRQHQAENGELRNQLLEEKRRSRFWRNLILSLLSGTLAVLVAILKAIAPIILKHYMQ